MNKIIITGRITQDIEIKVGGSGIEYTNFSVAVDRGRKDKDGNKQTDFFNCTAFSKSAAFLKQYFRKGDGITIEGRMESDKYTDKDGKNRVTWGVTVEQIEFQLSRKSDSASGGSGQFQELSEEESADLPF